MKRTTEYVTRLLREQEFESEEEMTVFLQGLQGKKVVAPARKALERAQDLMYAAFEAAHHESGRQDNVTAWTWWNRTSGRPCPTGCG